MFYGVTLSKDCIAKATFSFWILRALRIPKLHGSGTWQTSGGQIHIADRQSWISWIPHPARHRHVCQPYDCRSCGGDVWYTDMTGLYDLYIFESLKTRIWFVRIARIWRALWQRALARQSLQPWFDVSFRVRTLRFDALFLYVFLVWSGKLLGQRLLILLPQSGSVIPSGWARPKASASWIEDQQRFVPLSGEIII